MNVVIIGITSPLGVRLCETLLARGLTPVGLVHRADQQASLTAAGIRAAHVVPADKRTHAAACHAMGEAGGIVMATGSRSYSRDPASSPAAQLMAGAEKLGVRRFVLVSALLPSESSRAELGSELRPYLRDKEETERTLRERDLDWSILRSGRLDDSPATGRISLRRGEDPRPGGRISRSDLAATISEVLVAPEPISGTMSVSAGTVPIRTALEVGAHGAR